MDIQSSKVDSVFIKKLNKCKKLLKIYLFINNTDFINHKIFYDFIYDIVPDLVKQYKSDLKKYSLFDINQDELFLEYVLDWVEKKFIECKIDKKELINFITTTPTNNLNQITL